jgi:hypothetical protein
LVCDGVEKKLAPFLIFLIAGGIAHALRHEIPPLLVKLGQLFKFLLEIGIIGRALFVLINATLFFQYRIGLQFLLNEVAKLEGRSL